MRSMLNRIRLYGFFSHLILLFLLLGCAATKPLTKEDKVSIQSVSICRHVENTRRISVTRLGGSMPYMGTGGITTAITSGIKKGIAQADIDYRWQHICDRSGIDIRKIVKDQFEDQLKKSGFFHSIIDTEADAEFTLIISNYGFVHAPFSTDLKPVLSVIARLVRPDGTIVWKDYEVLTNFNSETPFYSENEYWNNPELIRDAFTVASKIVCGEIVNNMVGK